MSLRSNVDDLNSLILEFRFEEALNRYYAEDVKVYENDRLSNDGLNQYKEAAQNFLASLSNQSVKRLNTIVSNDMSVSEWHYKFDHMQWGHWDKVQLSVQKWRNGRIVMERHLYWD